LLKLRTVEAEKQKKLKN